MDIPSTLRDLYRFPGFEPRALLSMDVGNPNAIVVTLDRRPQKDTAVCAGNSPDNTTILAGDGCVISPAVIDLSFCTSRFFAWFVIGAVA